MCNSLPKKFRLIKNLEIKGVYQQGCVSRDNFFTCHYSPNDKFFSRLGVLVSKKKIPLAVQRNRIKRQVKEAFRLKRTELPQYDIVIVAKSSAGSTGNSELRHCLDNLFTKFGTH
ncbi:MAG: ribonuclease P protein component [Proteobacteria bacterium]|nr:ribonuclease P protein component [Pseudomonadota bacterium]